MYNVRNMTDNLILPYSQLRFEIQTEREKTRDNVKKNALFFSSCWSIFFRKKNLSDFVQQTI